MATNGTNGHTNGHAKSALCSVDEFLAESYDYVVVGGGTAGLCVAARLTENPDVKVAVIEAGADRMDDPQVSTPGLYPTVSALTSHLAEGHRLTLRQLIGREKYDWCFQSVEQPTAGGKVLNSIILFQLRANTS